MDPQGTEPESRPERSHVKQEPHYAGFWVRGVAYFIDLAVLVIAAWILEYVLMNAVLIVAPGGIDATTLQLFETGLLFCVAFPYICVSHLKWGQTLGKRAVGIQVVDEVPGEALSAGQVIERFFWAVASHLFLGAGFIIAAFHPKKRALHDLTCKTLVVHVPKRVF